LDSGVRSCQERRILGVAPKHSLKIQRSYFRPRGRNPHKRGMQPPLARQLRDAARALGLVYLAAFLKRREYSRARRPTRAVADAIAPLLDIRGRAVLKEHRRSPVIGRSGRIERQEIRECLQLAPAPNGPGSALVRAQHAAGRGSAGAYRVYGIARAPPPSPLPPPPPATVDCWYPLAV